MSGIDTKAIREAAASYVFWSERAKETPSALIRWTIPGLCDRVDALEERLRAVEAVAWSPSLQSCGGTTPDAEGCFVQDVLLKLRAALAPAASPAEQVHRQSADEPPDPCELAGRHVCGPAEQEDRS